MAARASAALGTSRGDGAARVLVALFFIGWLALPVADYRAIDLGEFTPGTALAGPTAITKAALVPLVLLATSFVVCAARWRAWRPRLVDIALAAFCAVPLIHGRPLDALYLACVWLALWLLGRVLLSDRAARRDALALVAVTGLALIPIALLEGATPPWLYGAVYGPHPFQTIGAARYLGYRPVGFFEDGNQYGIWTALTALAAVELARTDRRWRPVAVALILVAVAAQSAGALLLLALGAAAVLVRPTPPRWLLPTAGAALLGVAALYLSGALPLEHIARDTRPGQMVLTAFRKAGRGSLPWRISQDQRALPLIKQHPLVGQGDWAWWRPLGRRPWGLPMLVVGQYGLVGLALLLCAMLFGALATVSRGVRDERFALAVIVLLAGADAALNSTIYFPAILFAGALATAASPVRGPAT